ncbi:hypothetical protein V5O48_018465, partial [Marasmius crinis-equi]
MSVTPYAPTLEMLSDATDKLRLYGIEPKLAIIPTSEFQSTLMLQAPLHPLKLYTLASKHDLFDLASSISPYLLSFPIETLTDAAASSIGPIYLSRLFTLQCRRLDTLKRLLATGPHIHPPTPSCDFYAQGSVAKAWSLASAYLIWQARP